MNKILIGSLAMFVCSASIAQVKKPVAAKAPQAIMEISPIKTGNEIPPPPPPPPPIPPFQSIPPLPPRPPKPQIKEYKHTGIFASPEMNKVV